MSSDRTSRRNEQFFDVFTVFAVDGVTPVSGETVFAVDFSRDGVVETPAYSISEIGTTGNYLLDVPGGFDTNGFWVATVVPAFNSITWRSEIEVREHDVDSVAALILAGGTGTETVLLQLVDTANGNAPVPDALINVYDDTGLVFVTFGRTDTSGELTLLLDDDSYIIRVFKPGVSCLEQTIVVLNTGGATLQTFQIDCESIIVSPPPSPELCRMYADFISLDGLPFENFKVAVANLYDPESNEGLSVIEASRQYATDAAGHVEFDVVRGTRIRVTFVTSPLVRELTVPDKPVENLLTAMGSTTDVFQVVKK